MSAWYRSDPAGMRAFVSSQMVGAAMVSVASQLASAANQSGRSTYTARAATVQGGRQNSDRAGAEVVESDRSWADVNARHLRNITNTFRSRGGG